MFESPRVDIYLRAATTMRSVTLTVAICMTVSMIIGCQGAEEPKKIEVTPETKTQLDQEHAAKKAGHDAVGGGGAAPAPSSAGHSR